MLLNGTPVPRASPVRTDPPRPGGVLWFHVLSTSVARSPTWRLDGLRAERPTSSRGAAWSLTTTSRRTSIWASGCWPPSKWG